MQSHPSNRPHLDDLRNLPAGEIATLPAEHLVLLQEDAHAALEAAKRLKDLLDAAIDHRYRERAATLRRAEGKDTGTVRIEDGEFVVITDLPKRVKWDQARLAAIVEEIRAAGDDPCEYVSVELKVAERAYGAWPSSIRSAFAPARTVETGKPVYRIEPKEKP